MNLECQTNIFLFQEAREFYVSRGILLTICNTQWTVKSLSSFHPKSLYSHVPWNGGPVQSLEYTFNRYPAVGSNSSLTYFVENNNQ